MNPFEMPFPNPFGKTWLTSSFEAPAQSTHDYSLYREDFGIPAAIRQNIHMPVHADNFLVLSL